MCLRPGKGTICTLHRKSNRRTEYCVAQDGLQHLHIEHFSSPFKHRDNIARTPGISSSTFNVFPAALPMRDIAFSGFGCRTAIAVCEQHDMLSAAPLCGAILDRKPMRDGFLRLDAPDKDRVCLIRIYAQPCTPGWTAQLAGADIVESCLQVCPAQVLITSGPPNTQHFRLRVAPCSGLLCAMGLQQEAHLSSPRVDGFPNRIRTDKR